MSEKNNTQSEDQHRLSSFERAQKELQYILIKNYSPEIGRFGRRKARPMSTQRIGALFDFHSQNHADNNNKKLVMDFFHLINIVFN
jgi:hypothetical protein